MSLEKALLLSAYDVVKTEYYRRFSLHLARGLQRFIRDKNLRKFVFDRMIAASLRFSSNTDDELTLVFPRENGSYCFCGSCPSLAVVFKRRKA